MLHGYTITYLATDIEWSVEFFWKGNTRLNQQVLAKPCANFCISPSAFTCWVLTSKRFIWLLGEWLSGSAGMGFTPHIITVAAGEVWYLSLIQSLCPFKMCLTIEQYMRQTNLWCIYICLVSERIGEIGMWFWMVAWNYFFGDSFF